MIQNYNLEMLNDWSEIEGASFWEGCCEIIASEWPRVINFGKSESYLLDATPFKFGRWSRSVLCTPKDYLWFDNWIQKHFHSQFIVLSAAIYCRRHKKSHPFQARTTCWRKLNLQLSLSPSRLFCVGVRVLKPAAAAAAFCQRARACFIAKFIPAKRLGLLRGHSGSWGLFRRVGGPLLFSSRLKVREKQSKK